MKDSEVINYVRGKLIEQGKRSMAPGEHGGLKCAYKGNEDGTVRCAAGWLMDLSVLYPGFNTSGVYVSNYSSDSPFAAITAGGIADLKTQQDLVAALQGVHDSAYKSDFETGRATEFPKEEWDIYINNACDRLLVRFPDGVA